MYSPIAFMSTPAAIRYLAVGDIVEDARPINQGDVYRGITLPGFPAGDHHIVQTDLREEKRRGDARRRARDELRHRRVVLVGSEPKRPYQRPPLSKEHLPQLRARGQLLLPVIEPGPRA